MVNSAQPSPVTTTTGAVGTGAVGTDVADAGRDGSLVAPDPHDRDDAAPARPAGGVRVDASRAAGKERPAGAGDVFQLSGVTVRYGSALAVEGVDMVIGQGQTTAFIGPSGCGKSTLIRCLNRMNDLIPSARVSGRVSFHDVDLYGRDVDPVEVRRRIGMVFQKPNPFPRSIEDNITFGPKLLGQRKGLDDLVEESLVKAALWDEVKGKLKESALSLSGGQQQRLCIARAIATRPEVILMDEPCSALDPVSTAKVEDLMASLVPEYSIVIVTHNMQQAARVSDMTAFFTTDTTDDGRARYGSLVEYSPTAQLFTNPSDSRTESYISGRFG